MTEIITTKGKFYVIEQPKAVYNTINNMYIHHTYRIICLRECKTDIPGVAEENMKTEPIYININQIVALK